MFKIPKLKKDQLYFMWFDSGNRNYFVPGNNLEVMVNNLLQKYNSYCSETDKIKDLSEMAELAATEDYHFMTYIININTASDDDYRDFKNEIYLGDYLDYVRERTKRNA